MKLKSNNIIYYCKFCDKKFQDKINECNKCFKKEILPLNVYSLDKILSFNFFQNNIIGARNSGKSHEIASYLIKRWKENKYCFLWIKRVKEEIIHGLDIFAKLGYNFDSTGIYEEEKYINNKGKEKIKKIYFGFNFTISTARNSKGRQFPDNDIRTIWWDEYALESGFIYQKEMLILDSLFETIFRRKEDCKFICSNNHANPYMELFIDSEINWNEEWTFNYKKDIITHISPIKNKITGSTAKRLKNSKYYSYAYENESMIQDKFLINSFNVEFYNPEFCFRLGGFKEIFKFIKTDKEFVIDTCKNCNHDLVTIDRYNEIYEMKKNNKNAINELINAFYSKNLKFTKPIIKQLFWDWFSAEIYH